MTDQIINAAAVEEVPDILRRAMAGEHVLVVCQAGFDSQAKCQAFWLSHCRKNTARGGVAYLEGVSMRDKELVFISGGRIEWGHAYTDSGRRVGDFDHCIFDGEAI